MDELFAANQRAILGNDPAQVEQQVVGLFPGSRVFRRELSVGAFFGLELPGGDRVAVKVHRGGRAFLVAVQRVQATLAEAGFPCPRPLLEPTPVGQRLATAEEWLDGERADAREPRVRQLLAAALRLQIELAPSVDLPPVHPPDALWPEPHNALFDFELLASEAAWIDDVAQRARERMEGEPAVVGHSDWSMKHFRFATGRIIAVFDWDSLRLGSESSFVGYAAATHTADLDTLDLWRPRVADAIAFLADYGAETAAAAAAAVYVVAYTARCEHALAAAGATEFVTDARAALPEFAAELL